MESADCYQAEYLRNLKEEWEDEHDELVKAVSGCA